jgi:hypothetical protein
MANISTIKSSGGDYTTLSAWESDKQGTLTDIEVAECYDFGTSGLSDTLVVDGSTTAADKYFKITAASGQEATAVWSTGKFYLKSSSATYAVQLNDPYSIVEKIQIHHNVTSSATAAFYVPKEATIRYCFVRGSEAYTGGVYAADPCSVYRNIFWNCGKDYYGGIRGASSDAVDYHNNTVVHTGTPGSYAPGMRSNDAANILAKNNAVFGYPDNYAFYGTFQGGCDYNATDDNDDNAGGSNNLQSLTLSSQFNDPSNGDFTLLTGADLKDAGANLGSPYDVDIDGDTVSGTWDIGADEYVSGGGGYTLTASSGSMTLTGQSASLLFDRILSAGAGSVVLSGQDVSLLRDALLAAEAGAYALTGQDASLLLNRLLSADAGSVALTGYDVTLTYTPTGGYTLSAESGSFTLAGSDASLLMGRKLAAESGSITLDGQAASLLFNRLLASDAGTFTVAGADADLLRDYKLAAGAGSITLSGQSVTLDYSGEVLPDGTVSITFTVKQPSTASSVSAPSTTFTAH